MFVEKLTKPQVSQIIKKIYGKNFYIQNMELKTTKKGQKLLDVCCFDDACFWDVWVEVTDATIFIPAYKDSLRYEKGFAKDDNEKFQKAMYKFFGNQYLDLLTEKLKNKFKGNSFGD